MKRKKTDSIAYQLQAVCSKRIKPPPHVGLCKKDLPYWDAVINARARDSWTDVDLIFAGILSRCMADIETLTAEVKGEKNIEINARGETKINPKHTLLEILSRRSVALSRFLHIHASATQGRARDTGQRTKRERELLDSQPSDGLLAKPPVQ